MLMRLLQLGHRTMRPRNTVHKSGSLSTSFETVGPQEGLSAWTSADAVREAVVDAPKT